MSGDARRLPRVGRPREADVGDGRASARQHVARDDDRDAQPRDSGRSLTARRRARTLPEYQVRLDRVGARVTKSSTPATCTSTA